MLVVPPVVVPVVLPVVVPVVLPLVLPVVLPLVLPVVPPLVVPVVLPVVLPEPDVGVLADDVAPEIASKASTQTQAPPDDAFLVPAASILSVWLPAAKPVMEYCNFWY